MAEPTRSGGTGGNDKTNSNSITVNYNPTGGADKVLLLWGYWTGDSITLSSFTWNGSGATEVVATVTIGSGTSATRGVLYKVLDPSSGSQSAVLTLSTTSRPKGIIIEEWVATDESAQNSNTGTSNTPSVSVTVAQGTARVVAGFVQVGAHDGNAFAATSGTEHQDFGDAAGPGTEHSYYAGSISAPTASSSYANTATGDSSGNWIAIAAELYNATGDQTISPTLLQQLAAPINPTVTSQAFISPALFQQLLATIDPLVTSEVFVTPALTQQLVSTINPTVVPGSVNIIPTLIQQLLATINPTSVANQDTFPTVAAVATNTGTGTAATCSEPSGSVDGSLLIAVLSKDDDAETITDADGWTRKILNNSTSSHDSAIALYWIYRGASAPDLQWDLSAIEEWRITIYRIVDGPTSGDPFSGTPVFSDFDLDTTPDSPSLTTVDDGCLVFRMVLNSTDLTVQGDVSDIAAPTGSYTVQSEYVDSGTDPDLEQMTVTINQASAGATGTATFTLTMTSGNPGGQTATWAIKGSGVSNQTLSPTLLQQLAVTFDPTVSPGSVSILPAIIEQVVSTLDPTLRTEAFIIPSLLQQLVATIDPTVPPPNAPINPALIQQLIQTFDPTLDTVVTITPDLVSQSVVVYDPVVSAESSDQTLEPALIVQTVETIDPTVPPPIAQILPSLISQLVVTLSPDFVGEPGAAAQDERSRKQGWSG